MSTSLSTVGVTSGSHESTSKRKMQHWECAIPTGRIGEPIGALVFTQFRVIECPARFQSETEPVEGLT